MLNRKQKRVEDKRTPLEIAIDSAKTSSYRLMMPMLNAEHVRVRDPLSSSDKHFSTKDPAFYDLMADLYSKGLNDKLIAEFNNFILIDPKWATIKEQVDNHINSLNIKDSADV